MALIFTPFKKDFSAYWTFFEVTKQQIAESIYDSNAVQNRQLILSLSLDANTK